jgi:molybdopterin molybdotransferase
MPAKLLPWTEARERVIRTASSAIARVTLDVETVSLGDAAGRRLAVDVTLDRDQPPFDRSTRDGFAVRAADVGGAGSAGTSTQSPGASPRRLERIGEVRAGQAPKATVGWGTCVEIFTGAELPAGADAVVMIEDTSPAGDGTGILVRRAVAAGENVVRKGAEGRRGDLALGLGARLGAAQIALCASVGADAIACRRRPRVSILSTGDEIVPITQTPGPQEIRNSNAPMLAAQVRAVGAHASIAAPAPDEATALEQRLAHALAGADVLVVTGGVSMGKYDLVEPALARLGAEVVFDGVAIRPGKPVTFGTAQGKLWFGLPGNPLSAMVTFELFVRPALEMLAGAKVAPAPLHDVALAAAWAGRPLPLTLFLPARVETGADGRPKATPLASQGSADLVATSGADGFVVVPEGTAALAPGTSVGFLPGPG